MLARPFDPSPPMPGRLISIPATFVPAIRHLGNSIFLSAILTPAFHLHVGNLHLGNSPFRESRSPRMHCGRRCSTPPGIPSDRVPPLTLPRNSSAGRRPRSASRTLIQGAAPYAARAPGCFLRGLPAPARRADARARLRPPRSASLVAATTSPSVRALTPAAAELRQSRRPTPFPSTPTHPSPFPNPHTLPLPTLFPSCSSSFSPSPLCFPSRGELPARSFVPRHVRRPRPPLRRVPTLPSTIPSSRALLGAPTPCRPKAPNHPLSLPGRPVYVSRPIAHSRRFRHLARLPGIHLHAGRSAASCDLHAHI